MPFEGKSREEIELILAESKKKFAHYKAKGLSLDMSRGKPNPEQLDLSMEMMDILGSDADFSSENGADCRNYGELSGIPEIKRLFSELLDIPAENIFVGGNSSLNLMFHTFSRAYAKGLADSKEPWSKCETVKFLCPVPGYDRHFAVCEYFGIEMINVPMLDTGPDMAVVENLVRHDASIKGIWCVPIYSNPDGCIYSAETISRLASMKCAADDFTIMWDNAYSVHSLYAERVSIAGILSECEKYGNANRVLLFTSANKITLTGAGVSCIGGSKASMLAFIQTAAISTIGYDKLNMLRHARFLKDKEAVLTLMEKHAALLRPKFEAVDDVLRENIGEYSIAEWTKPHGGYFISLNAYPSTAKKTYELCREAGVTLTAPGATFPYGMDPEDKNIRIAPSFPSLSEIKDATEILSIALIITAAEETLHRATKD